MESPSCISSYGICQLGAERLFVKTHLIWGIGWLYFLAFEEESGSTWILPLSLAKGLHQLFQLGAPLDLEEDFIVAVGDFDVQMFARTSCRSLGSGAVG